VAKLIVYVFFSTMTTRIYADKIGDNNGTDNSPAIAPVDSDEGSSVYDSEDGVEYTDDDDEEIENEDVEEGENDDEFEDQGSSDDDDDRLEKQNRESESDDEILLSYENKHRSWVTGKKRSSDNSTKVDPKVAAFVHTDDLSSDDEDDDGKGNRIGKVPLHWYDGLDHIGYDALGGKVTKTNSATNGDRIDQALANQDNFVQGKHVVYDALNDRSIELSERQLELIRRVQGGAYAHPEHDANPDHIDYFSGVDPILSGINSNKYEPKARFQPSQLEKLQVDRLLQRLDKGYINMDYLTGKIRDMNDAKGKSDHDKPFAIWTGDEEDELNMRKGPQNIAAPKVPPPGHAASYIPPDEYLPTDDDLKSWEDLPAKERPHGHMIPKKFPNLRSVGAYQHSVREAFERCLDLYLCPRVLKRRLNIDPETLVPRLPRAQDLKPFPTVKCIEYLTPCNADEVAPVIRCVTASPNGQFMASGASDGYVRLWEVQTGRLLRSWNLATITKDLNSEATHDELESSDTIAPIVCIEWNPNRLHHCLLASVGSFIVVLATGTSGQNDTELSNALLESAIQGGNVDKSSRASKAVKWISLKKIYTAGERSISSTDKLIGPICALHVSKQVSSLRWQGKGDYFVSVSPKAGAAAVLIHQLSKGNTQQPFTKVKGETQHAQQAISVCGKSAACSNISFGQTNYGETTCFGVPMDIITGRSPKRRSFNCWEFGPACNLV
jgi:ribosome biogenesis protein ERB1